MFARLAAGAAAGLWLVVQGASAGDWPMWRANAARGGAVPDALPAELRLQWVRQLPPLNPAWPDQPLIQFDAGYEPIVVGRNLVVASPHNDGLTAYDTRTGAPRWSLFTDGPVRFAPAAWDGKVYFGSDDGHLYCADVENGSILWKFRGGPADRRILGNGRLISTWPVRGAPVVADGTVYFAAGIWPFMGVFIHALDARTGAVVWTNDGDGSIFIRQPHNAESFAGIAPQGQMTVSGDMLLIPGGRSVPAGYDRKTGKLVHYRLAENSKRGGGTDLCAADAMFFDGGAAFEMKTGAYLGGFNKPVVVAGGEIFGYGSGKVRAYDAKTSKLKVTETFDRKGVGTAKASWSIGEPVAFDWPKLETFIKAGPRLYLGNVGKVTVVELPLPKGKPPVIAATLTFEGTPTSLLAADDRLFVVTHEGRIHCFGPGSADTRAYLPAEPIAPPADPWTLRAAEILKATDVRSGYAIAWGVGSGRLVAELARKSELRIIAVDRDPARVAAVRADLMAAGLYGDRVAVHVGDPLTFPFPPYLASLMVSEDLAGAGVEPDAAFLRKAYPPLRPFGGVACLPVAAARRADFRRAVGEAELANAKTADCGDWVLLSREGALPGSADWTHENADPANTRVSKDLLVKAPLGLLWFGGSSHAGILPRHGHGPQPQVMGGRLFIEGVDMIRAMDIYTGRVLWESPLPGLGAFYNKTSHEPGANSTGTNFISTPDGIYVVYGKSCVRLDPATGRKLSEFQLPVPAGAKDPPDWGYINVAGDYIVGGADPLHVDPRLNRSEHKQLALWDAAAGKSRLTLEGHGDCVNAMAFSPDGAMLVTVSDDTSVRLWDTATGKLTAALMDHPDKVSGVAFAPDGKTFATASADKTVRIRDAATGKPLHTIEAKFGRTIALAYSPDGKILAGAREDEVVKLWNADDGSEFATLPGHQEKVNCLAFSPDGETLATGSDDETVRLWEVATGKLRETIDEHTGKVTCVAYSRDGKLLAVGREKSARIWDAHTLKTKATLPGYPERVRSVAFSPDGKTLAVAVDDGTVKMWDVAAGKALPTLKGRAGVMACVAWTPDGKTLAAGGDEKSAAASKIKNENLSSSHSLMVMDRRSGSVLWSVAAQSGFRHNAICVGGGRLYCIDRASAGELARLKRRGEKPAHPPRLLALDLATGKEVWKTDKDVFGTWLSYSEPRDVLVESGRVARDTLTDEPKGMRAYQGRTGKVLWHNGAYVGPAMIHGDTVLKDLTACDLVTGAPKMRTDPLTGKPVEWSWTRTYGCNTPMASEHLLTFRSGAAGYFDLCNDGGTGNLGGFRSSCTNNLVVAGGLLNAPDYTRTCTCSYQNQTSLAFVHMPEAEMWTYLSTADSFGPVRRLGLNLGGAGDRRAPDGTLWLEYPDTGGKSEKIEVTSVPEKPETFRRHSSAVTGPLNWVTASGVKGVTSITINLIKEPPKPPSPFTGFWAILNKPGPKPFTGYWSLINPLPKKPDPKPKEKKETKPAKDPNAIEVVERSYTVRLYFAEPEALQPGRRVFSVALQGRDVLTEFDIVREAGAPLRTVVKEFRGVRVTKNLVVTMRPSGPSAGVPVLCGIEVAAEGW